MRTPRDQSCSRCGRTANPLHSGSTLRKSSDPPLAIAAASVSRTSASASSSSTTTTTTPLAGSGAAPLPPSLALPAETHPSRQRSGLPQSHSPLGTAQRQSPRGSPDGPDQGPGPNPPDPQPSGGPGGPGGPMPFRLRYWILLLAEYGGIYGTAAVILAGLTNVDAFGGFHWDANDVALGLGLMAPALAWDALVGLPDWTTRQEDAEALVRLFVDPELLRAQSAAAAGAAGAAGGAVKGAGGKAQEQGQQQDEHAEARASTSLAAKTTAEVEGADGAAARGGAGRQTGAAAAAATVAPAVAVGSRTGPGDRPEPGAAARGGTGTAAGAAGTREGGGPPSSALWAASQRLRMALELMQETSIRNNPGARLTPLQEAAVIGVAVTADEMLYRAVLLTLFGRWLRDRFYEAGAEEMLALPGGAALDTAAAAQWTALAVGAVAGAAVFAAKAWQEATMAKRLRAVQVAEREEAAKALRKQRLMGQHMSEEELRELNARQDRLQAAHESLVASIGMQGALVWVLEGAREVYQVTAVGAAFILTGNLAAPLAGSLAGQVLVSLYQRLGLQRNLQRRAEVVAKRRQKRLEEEAAAAVRAAAAAAAATSIAMPDEVLAADGERAAGGDEVAGSERAQQQQHGEDSEHGR